MKRKNEGITLIALVITVIVLIILAGVTISMVVDDNGIITKAKQAKQNMTNASAEEKELMQNMLNEMNEIESGNDNSDILNPDKMLIRCEYLEKKVAGDLLVRVYIEYPDDYFDIEKIIYLMQYMDMKKEMSYEEFIKELDKFIEQEGMTKEEYINEMKKMIQQYEEEEKKPIEDLIFDQLNFLIVAESWGEKVYSAGIEVNMYNNYKTKTGFNKKYTEFIVNENGKYTITAEDWFGTKAETTIEISNIDKNLRKDTSKWNLTKVDIVTSEEGLYVPVPKGFTVSTIVGERSVENGFVIKQGNDGNKTSGINEFVWIPVINIDNLYNEKNDTAQLWSWGIEGYITERVNPAKTLEGGSYEMDMYPLGSIKEPGVTSGEWDPDSKSSNLEEAGLHANSTKDDFEKQLKEEFIDMKNSIEKYGGFYIGRYETGNLSQNIAVSQRNNTDIGNQTWYTQYRLNKNIVANDNVKTSLVWGCQWDAMLRWIQTNSNPDVSKMPSTYDEEYLNRKGNLTRNSIPTGSIEAYKINNIYDIIGNVAEWTMGILTLSRSEVENYILGRAFVYANGSTKEAEHIEESKSDLGGSRATMYISN